MDDIKADRLQYSCNGSCKYEKSETPTRVEGQHLVQRRQPLDWSYKTVSEPSWIALQVLIETEFDVVSNFRFNLFCYLV